MNITKISAPAHLNEMATKHYEKLVETLTKQGCYNELEDGLIEIAAQLYATINGNFIEPREKTKAMEMYPKYIKLIGHNASKDVENNSESDLKEFMRD